MTNQDPNEELDSPQRTFAEWLAQCQTINPNSTHNNLLSAIIFPSEIRWENDELMVFDIVVYDLKVQSTEESAIQEGINNFLSTIVHHFAKETLTYALSSMGITTQ